MLKEILENFLKLLFHKFYSLEDIISSPMSIHSNLGCIRGAHEEQHYEWKIGNFITMVENESFGFCESPLFSFGNILWYLQLQRKSNMNPECMALHLFTRSARAYPVEYNLGLKEMDNSVEQLDTGMLSGNTMYTDGCFMKRSELLQRKCVLAPSDVITIVCILKRGTIPCINPKPNKLINPNLQLEKIKGFFSDGEFCDVTLNVKNKEFKAHKMILAATSPVLESYFKHETLEKQTGIINIPDCDPGSFKAFLKYLYCGELDNISLRSSFELYKTADKYDVKALKMLCIENIDHNLNVENFCDVISFAEERDDANLFAIAQDFFNGKLREILISSEWKSLLGSNFNLANKLLIEMASSTHGVVKRPKLE